MKVEVVYASPTQQVIVPLEVQSPCTVEQAIQQSTILQQFPEIDITKQSVGIFSRKVNLTEELKEHDRVEIYRPLLMDPKQARLLRARQRHF